MKSLKEEKEPKDGGDTKRWREEPGRLSQRIKEKYADKDSDRTRESNSIVGSNTDETSDFKLSKHETYESECTV